MTVKQYFPYCYKFNGKHKYLIWYSNGQDGFVLDDNNKMTCVSSRNRLIKFTMENKMHIKWEECGNIDLDKFFIALKNIRTRRASSIRTCSILLAGWNFIEDILFTFNLEQCRKALHTPVLNKAYDKLFYGNNLPAITPEGNEYQPLWLKEEIKEMRFIRF